MTDQTPSAETLNQDPQVIESAPQLDPAAAPTSAETTQPVATPQTPASGPGTVTGKGDSEPDTRQNARIRQLVDEKKAALAKADEQASLAESLRRQLEALKPKPAGDIADHPNQEAFFKAALKEVTVEARREAMEQQAKDLEQAATNSRNQVFEARVQEFSAQASDYHQVVGNPNLQITPMMADAIRVSETGPQVAYYLGKNPAEASRIARLTPLEQATAIGAISARVALPEKRATTAPAPVKTVTGATVKASPGLEDLSYEEYRKARMGSAA